MVRMGIHDEWARWADNEPERAGNSSHDVVVGQALPGFEKVVPHQDTGYMKVLTRFGELSTKGGQLQDGRTRWYSADGTLRVTTNPKGIVLAIVAAEIAPVDDDGMDAQYAVMLGRTVEDIRDMRQNDIRILLHLLRKARTP